MYIDQQLYDILCMFDFPGFMVDKESILLLGTGIRFIVRHRWGLAVEPVGGTVALVHDEWYTLDFDYFDFSLCMLAPV